MLESLFKGKLPMIREQVGIMSIDTVERLWEVVHHNPETNRLVLISKDKKAALIGRMAKRQDDLKFCIAIEIKAKLDEQWGLCGMETWHMYPSDYAARFDELHQALKDASVIS